jgi:hypothetical protein
VTREAFLDHAAEQWRQLDPDEYPFIHHIVDEFATHIDADQFRAGLDLLLAGLRLQAETSGQTLVASEAVTVAACRTTMNTRPDFVGAPWEPRGIAVRSGRFRTANRPVP